MPIVEPTFRGIVVGQADQPVAPQSMEHELKVTARDDFGRVCTVIFHGDDEHTADRLLGCNLDVTLRRNT